MGLFAGKGTTYYGARWKAEAVEAFAAFFGATLGFMSAVGLALAAWRLFQ